MVDIIQVPAAAGTSGIVYFIVALSTLMSTGTIFAMAYLTKQFLDTRTSKVAQPSGPGQCPSAENCPHSENCPIYTGNCPIPPKVRNSNEAYLPMMMALASGKDETFKKLLTHQITGDTKSAIKEKVVEVLGNDNSEALQGYIDGVRTEIIDELKDEIKDEIKGVIKRGIKERLLAKHNIEL